MGKITRALSTHKCLRFPIFSVETLGCMRWCNYFINWTENALIGCTFSASNTTRCRLAARLYRDPL